MTDKIKAEIEITMYRFLSLSYTPNKAYYIRILSNFAEAILEEKTEKAKIIIWKNEYGNHYRCSHCKKPLPYSDISYCCQCGYYLNGFEPQPPEANHDRKKSN